MIPRRLTVALAAAAGLVAAAPADAATLKGTVTGTPYVAGGGKAAVPVIFATTTVRRARLRSPVGVLLVPLRRAIPAPEGALGADALRLGDRFSSKARVSRRVRRGVYVRVAPTRMRVSKRAGALSAAELQRLVGALQLRVDAVERSMQQLASYTVGAITSLKADVASLRADLNALRADVQALRGTVASLEHLTSEQKLQTESVLTDVTTLLTTSATITTSINELQQVAVDTVNRVAGTSATSVGDAITAVNAMTGLQTRLQLLADDISSVSTTLTGAVGTLRTDVFGADGTADGVGGIQQALATVTGQVGTLETRVGSICTNWSTTLSGAKRDVVDLLGIKIGTATLPTLPACA